MKNNRLSFTCLNAFASLAGMSLIVAACGGADDSTAGARPTVAPGGTNQQAPVPAPVTPATGQAPAPTPPAASSPTPPPASGSTPTPAPGPGSPISDPEFDATSNAATYRVTFKAQWTEANGFGNVPASAHFSPVVAAQVNNQSQLWASGRVSSSGIERVAEDGSTSEFSNEINAEVAANAALGVQILSGTNADNSSTTELTFTRVFPSLTFASMVAPSPDWFVGINKFSMLDGASQWIEQIQLELPVYDAGTEQGDAFSGSNPPNIPVAVIERLNGLVAGELNFVDGLVGGNAIASMRLVRIR